MNRTSLFAGLACFIAAVSGQYAETAIANDLPRFASQPSTTISCEATPFGRHATLGEDAEFITLIATSTAYNSFAEHVLANPGNPDPLVNVFDRGIYAGMLSGSTFLKAVDVDLDGDGRDEIVTAHRLYTGQLRLGVFQRVGDPTGVGVILIDTWTANQQFNQVELAAGDFDGSADGTEELAVAIRTSGPTQLQLFVLTGDTNGGIAEADDYFAGYWNRNGNIGLFSLASGDLLLDGREQIAVVNENNPGGNGNQRSIHFHLLEYLPQTAALPIVHGDDMIGSALFSSFMGQSFAIDDETSHPAIQRINALEADAGDIVGSAAAELVVHVQFEGSSNMQYLGQRLHHFTTTRNIDNQITGIALATRGPGREFDSSRLIQDMNQGAAPSFAATIASIDRISPGEIVLARSTPNNELLVSAYKASIDMAAGFTYIADGLTVQFNDASVGAIVEREWNFDDNSDPVYQIDPTHTYDGENDYLVSLRVTDSIGDSREYSTLVRVEDSGQFSGGDPAPDLYRLDEHPSYEAFYTLESISDISFLKLAIGDMDKDGIAEVMTAARYKDNNVLRSVWRLADTADPDSFAGRHLMQSGNAITSMTAMELLASDFDGDSVRAVLGTDCRSVTEPQLRQVVWMPPYFHRLQAGAGKGASFGQSTVAGSSAERSFGTFTSHDVSAYIGGSVGSELLGVRVAAKATAGYNYQSSRGALFGSENSFTVGEGFLQDQGEALVVYEENMFDCYSYDVMQADTGLATDSSVRMCERVPDSSSLTASDAEFWDRQIPAATPDHPPAQWLPLHRDWSSIALFKTVGTSSTLLPGSGADKVTDGLFGTGAETAGDTPRPYLQIDLGSIQDISNIRVFPMAGQAGHMQGFRIYTSVAAMTGPDIPTGAGVQVFAPETADDAAYDQWSLWTRDRGNPDNLLRARYVRLQHPGTASLRVAEIQIFGAVHVEPPLYPDYVCDPVRHDGLFRIMVWDPGSGANGSFRAIDGRGELLWTGFGNDEIMSGCENHVGVLKRPNGIWRTVAIGSSGIPNWYLSQDTGNLIGSNTSFESSVRVGAEFDLEAGFIATVQAGGGYEFTSGITEENQTTSFWGTGLEIGGEIGGFQEPFNDAVTINACRYAPRPYAYKLVDTSNTGYQHTAYVVDYAVRQRPNYWQRPDVPGVCTGDFDAIFASGFE